MPSKIITKDDLKAMYPPNGVPTARNQRPDDFLFQACKDGCSIASLNRALQKGANVNARNIDGITPLMYAALNWIHPQYMNFLTKLLESGAEVNVEDARGSTVLDNVREQVLIWEAAREKEIGDQQLRREIMEGKGPTGFGYGTREDARKCLIWNQPLADELDTFKNLPQLYAGMKLLEANAAKVGEEPFKPAYLTDEEFVEKRDKLEAKYKDARYTYRGH